MLTNVAGNIFPVSKFEEHTLSTDVCYKVQKGENYHLLEISKLELPDKIFGASDIEELTATILRHYAINGNVNAAFIGEKGGGKTLQCRHTALKSNLPTIIVDKADLSDEFINFIRQLPNCVLIIDEFEKLYNSAESTDALSSFIEGIATNKGKIILLAGNCPNLPFFMENRPTRVRYVKEYNQISKAIYDELLSFHLGDEVSLYQEAIFKRLSRVSHVSFDVVNSLLEEFVIENYDLDKACKYLNLKLDDSYRWSIRLEDTKTGDVWVNDTIISSTPPEIEFFNLSSRYLKEGTAEHKYIRLDIDNYFDELDIDFTEIAPTIFEFKTTSYDYNVIGTGSPITNNNFYKA